MLTGPRAEIATTSFAAASGLAASRISGLNAGSATRRRAVHFHNPRFRIRRTISRVPLPSSGLAAMTARIERSGSARTRRCQPQAVVRNADDLLAPLRHVRAATRRIDAAQLEPSALAVEPEPVDPKSPAQLVAAVPLKSSGGRAPGLTRSGIRQSAAAGPRKYEIDPASPAGGCILVLFVRQRRV